MRTFLCSIAVLVFVLLAWAPMARAQATHDSTISIAPDGVVSIGVVDCNVHVVGSARKDVKVTSSSGDVRVSGDGDHVSVHVRPGAASEIDVAVPAGVHLEVRGIEATITVHEVSGPVQVGTVNGNVTLDGSPRDVEASSISGNVDVSIRRGNVRASSVSGSVGIHLAGGGTAWAHTVSGSITIGGAPLSRAEAQSMSGNIDLDARLEGDGLFEMHTHSGDVRVSVQKTPPVSIDVRTHAGRVDGPDAGAPAPGSAHTVLTVRTFSGDVHVERK
ncbi:MAG TPA: DUF4097 family beta strand repeat-containing protein [Polyangiaceae bacterium]|nr:DUF4097 family beta strand repeat-containing protein [Polyangiaceae bacterium]